MAKRYIFLSLFCFGGLFANEFSLELSRDKKLMIDQLIRVVATKEEDKLFAESQSLMPALMSLMNESPLKIIAYVCRDKQLKKYMEEASLSPVKWDLFQRGFSTKMTQECSLEDFDRRLEVLLFELSLTRGEVELFIEEKNWNGFILYVLHNSGVDL
jgi:hypothetical protein